MNIIFFAHPAYLGYQSMIRYSQMLADGMRERGHKVELWMPKPKCFRLPVPTGMRKWMGYLDQYILFPSEVRNCINSYSQDTLFVFTDHALGPWVSLIADRPHIIHCHDFLAQRSAIGEIPENPTSWTGRLYQSFIRRGYSKGKNFISISQKSQEDLHYFISNSFNLSEIVYNGLNQAFTPINPIEARKTLSKRFNIDLSKGFILHVGGNQWYKNRSGVIELYDAWYNKEGCSMPLLLIGEKPDKYLINRYRHSPFQADIHFLSGIEDQLVRLAYASASVFLFPSIAEGFGWPIAEAMASGCPVITTNEAPMTEVAGSAAYLIPRRPNNCSEVSSWAKEGAKVLNKVLNLSSTERRSLVESGLINAKRFDTQTTLDKIELIYQNTLQSYKQN